MFVRFNTKVVRYRHVTENNSRGVSCNLVVSLLQSLSGTGPPPTPPTGVYSLLSSVSSRWFGRLSLVGKTGRQRTSVPVYRLRHERRRPLSISGDRRTFPPVVPDPKTVDRSDTEGPLVGDVSRSKPTGTNAQTPDDDYEVGYRCHLWVQGRLTEGLLTTYLRRRVREDEDVSLG